MYKNVFLITSSNKPSDKIHPLKYIREKHKIVKYLKMGIMCNLKYVHEAFVNVSVPTGRSTSPYRAALSDRASFECDRTLTASTDGSKQCHSNSFEQCTTIKWTKSTVWSTADQRPERGSDATRWNTNLFERTKPTFRCSAD